MTTPSTFRLPGTDGPDIRVDRPLIGRATVRVDGQRIPVTPGTKDAYAIPMPDGTTRTVRIEEKVSGLTAIAEDGSRLSVGPVTPMWVTVMTFLPMALVAVGGLIGGLVGAVGVAINTAISRTSAAAPVKAVAMVGVLGLAALVWWFGARAFLGAVTPLPTYVAGECVTGLGPPTEGDVDASGVRTIDCASEHEGEVIGVTTIAGADDATYPGQAAIEAQASIDCVAMFGTYVGAPFGGPALEIIYLHPSEETWGRGDRALVCLATGPGGAPMTGSVAGTGR